MSESHDYVTVGSSCARCEGMVGRYAYPVGRPHDYCDCEITPMNTNITRECQMTEWIITSREFCNGTQREYICKVTVKVTVRCVHPETKQQVGDPRSEEFEFTQTEEEERDGVSRLATFAREKAREMCVVCSLVG